MGEPRRAASMFAQMPFVRTATVEQRRQWHTILVESRQTAAQRRTRVLAHPDLAARAPRGWAGYVPPRVDSDGRANTSPIRRELIDILHAVAEREAAG